MAAGDPSRQVGAPVSERAASVIVTGGPGAGKTTLLVELAARGYPTVGDSARAIIAERLARGDSPRPNPVEFADAIMRRDVEKYLQRSGSSNWVFFDRGLIDALGMLQDVSPLPASALASWLARHPFHPMVFVLPPWEAIYTNDAERDQSFAEAVEAYERVVRWYRLCGYVLNEVPCLPVAGRADYVLRALAENANRAGGIG